MDRQESVSSVVMTVNEVAKAKAKGKAKAKASAKAKAKTCCVLRILFK